MRTKHFLPLICAAMISVLFFSDIASAARWRYHAWRNGWITVYGTHNCRRVTGPLRCQPVYRCHTYAGYLPWYCNDFMVRYYWGPSCGNVTWTKYIAPPCPLSCWRHRWVLGPLYEYFEDYFPYAYPNFSEVVIPSFGDPNGNLTGNQNLFVFVDMGQWLDAGQPFAEPIEGTDPNSVSFNFENGVCSALPGFTVIRMDDANEPEDMMTFNPDAPSTSYPFEVADPNQLLTGILYLQDVQRFDNEPYDGNMMPADNDFNGQVDMEDFARFAPLWLRSITIN